MHGDGSVRRTALQQLHHLAVARLLVRHGDGGHALPLQRADVGHVQPHTGGHHRRLHGVLLPVLAAHAGQQQAGTAAGAAGLQILRHLTEGLRDGLIYVLHAYSPICAASVSAKPRMASAIM